MKNIYKSSEQERKSDKIIMITFLIIFAICFLPFALKKAGKSNDDTQPVNAGFSENEKSGPDQPENIATVQPKPGIRLHYSQQNSTELTDDMLMSEAAILYDKESKTVLYAKNADKALFPASTTKILTAYTALKNLPPDFHLKVGTELSLLQPESSLAYLNEGNILTLEDALYALLLPSGNDAAYVIAVNTARQVSGNPDMTDPEAVRYFCELMNNEAINAGADRTHFCVPDGYHDPFHYTTAEDLLRIAIITDDFPLIAQIVSSPSRPTKIVSGESYCWDNGNCLVVNDNGYFLPFATGLKTGYTDEAGYCMVATASLDGRDLIAVTMNSPSLAGRYTDAAKLFYSVYDPEKLKEPAETTAPENDEPENSDNSEDENNEDYESETYSDENIYE